MICFEGTWKTLDKPAPMTRSGGYLMSSGLQFLHLRSNLPVEFISIFRNFTPIGDGEGEGGRGKMAI